jgi:hypothetical protein
MSINESDMAVAREMEMYDSTATLNSHSARVCSGRGYWNIGNRGALAGGGLIDPV